MFPNEPASCEANVVLGCQAGIRKRGGERTAMEGESVLLETNHLRCPACFLIRDQTPKHFTCTLTRCPRVFLDVTPPGVQIPTGVRIEARNPK